VRDSGDFILVGGREPAKIERSVLALDEHAGGKDAVDVVIRIQIRGRPMTNLGASRMNALPAGSEKLHGLSPLVVEHRFSQTGEPAIHKRLVVTNHVTECGWEAQHGVANGDVPDDAPDESLAQLALTNQETVRTEAAPLTPVGYVTRKMLGWAGQDREAMLRITALEKVPECVPDVLWDPPLVAPPIN
jgi:hypothetical protein